MKKKTFKSEIQNSWLRMIREILSNSHLQSCFCFSYLNECLLKDWPGEMVKHKCHQEESYTKQKHRRFDIQYPFKACKTNIVTQRVFAVRNEAAERVYYHKSNLLLKSYNPILRENPQFCQYTTSHLSCLTLSC